MTPAELSTQIAKVTEAIADSVAMEQLRRSIWAAQREAKRVEEATQTLDFAQRSRLRRVFVTWDQQVQAQLVLGSRTQPPTGYAPSWSFRDDSATAPSPASLDFIGYLENAHRHPAIARKGDAGVRWWFETWRQVAIQALREGVGANEVSTIIESVPRGKRRFRRRPRKLSITRVLDWMRKRIVPVIHPNPPNGLRLHSNPVIGGEPVAIQA
jgi:hypothetical protein